MERPEMGREGRLGRQREGRLTDRPTDLHGRLIGQGRQELTCLMSKPILST